MNLALVFPGQGSQYIGMGQNLYQKYSEIRELYDQASHILGFDIKKMCFEGQMDELTKTENAQPAILLTSYAYFQVYRKEIGIQPLLTAGHSLGEITALVCSEAISFEDGLKLSRKRGELIAEAVKENNGGMVAIIGASHLLVEEICKCETKGNEFAVISNLNSPDQVVVSGSFKALENIKKRMEADAYKVVYLKVSAPFHSRLMIKPAELLRENIKDMEVKKCKMPVISNINVRPYLEKCYIKKYLAKQLTEKVSWAETMSYFYDNQVRTVVEIGPGITLKNLCKKNYSRFEALSISEEKDFLRLVEMKKDKLVQNNSGSIFYPSILDWTFSSFICTKNRNVGSAGYDIAIKKYASEFNQLKEMFGSADEKQEIELIRNGFVKMKDAMKIKGLTDQEVEERLSKIIEKTGYNFLI